MTRERVRLILNKASLPEVSLEELKDNINTLTSDEAKTLIGSLEEQLKKNDNSFGLVTKQLKETKGRMANVESQYQGIMQTVKRGGLHTLDDDSLALINRYDRNKEKCASNEARLDLLQLRAERYHHLISYITTEILGHELTSLEVPKCLGLHPPKLSEAVMHSNIFTKLN